MSLPPRGVLSCSKFPLVRIGLHFRSSSLSFREHFPCNQLLPHSTHVNNGVTIPPTQKCRYPPLRQETVTAQTTTRASSPYYNLSCRLFASDAAAACLSHRTILEQQRNHHKPGVTTHPTECDGDYEGYQHDGLRINHIWRNNKERSSQRAVGRLHTDSYNLSHWNSLSPSDFLLLLYKIS